ncbi:MAG TPA: hypothetical protein VKZ53_01795 [Candidatus Angelobacter sp.]|nr:hypothetical protein [Candidatus Angelobacter sp.]
MLIVSDVDAQEFGSPRRLLRPGSLYERKAAQSNQYVRNGGSTLARIPW